MQLDGLARLTLVLNRYMMSIIAGIMVILYFGKGPFSDINTRTQVIALAARIASGLCYYLLQMTAIVLIPITIMNLIISTNGVLASFLSWLFFKEKLDKVEVAALLSSYLGIVILTVSGPEENS